LEDELVLGDEMSCCLRAIYTLEIDYRERKAVVSSCPNHHPKEKKSLMVITEMIYAFL